MGSPFKLAKKTKHKCETRSEINEEVNDSMKVNNSYSTERTTKENNREMQINEVWKPIRTYQPPERVKARKGQNQQMQQNKRDIAKIAYNQNDMKIRKRFSSSDSVTRDLITQIVRNHILSCESSVKSDDVSVQSYL